MLELQARLDLVGNKDDYKDGQIDETYRDEFDELQGKESQLGNEVYDTCATNSALWDYARQNWRRPKQ